MTHHTGSDEGLSEAERAFVAKWDPGEFTGIPTGFRRDLATVILAARAATPDALRERVEALADRWEIFSGSATDERIGSLLASMAAEVRAALAERPTDGAGTCTCIPVPAEPRRHFGGLTVDPACPQHGAGT